MPQGRNLLVGIIVLALLVIITGIYLSQKPSQPANNPPSSTNAGQDVVTIDSNGFNPPGLTIKKGGSVTWKNTDSALHQVDSNPHPVHTDYLPLNSVDLIQPGGEKSLSFPDSGTYKYHDHLNPQFMGEIVVR